MQGARPHPSPPCPGWRHRGQVFGDIEEPARLRACVEQWAPRLFRWYEALLNEASRDRNLALARREPGAWRVAGSLEFLARLREAGARNYFVTGAVLAESGPPTGMLEELEAIGVEVGAGKLVEAALGSRWDEKVPKIEIIRNLLAELDAKAGSAYWNIGKVPRHSNAMR